MKLLYFVHHTLFDREDGYASRTHSIAKHLISKGYSLLVVSKIANSDADLIQHHDGIDYYRLPRNFDPSNLREGLVAELVEVIEVFKPQKLIAASDWTVGNVMAKAAERLGFTFAYEMRGLWNLTRVSNAIQQGDIKRDGWLKNEAFQKDFEKELSVCHKADKVFTISTALADLMHKAGVQGSKTAIVPNGIELNLSSKTQDDTAACRELTIGYIGSLADFEGVSLILDAVKAQDKQETAFKVLIVGGSPGYSSRNAADDPAVLKLKQQAQQLGINNSVEIRGRVTSEQALNAYKEIDVIVLPRLDLPVCQIVPPLKPIEAALYKKPLIVSDVAPLKEIVDQGGAVSFKAGDSNDLTRALGDVCKDSHALHEAGYKAFNWVSMYRTTEITYGPLCDYLY